LLKRIGAPYDQQDGCNVFHGGVLFAHGKRLGPFLVPRCQSGKLAGKSARDEEIGSKQI
jgi:hypothetical protein